MKYPLIERLGLKSETLSKIEIKPMDHNPSEGQFGGQVPSLKYADYVQADELEAVLSAGQPIYFKIAFGLYDFHEQKLDNTHQGFLLNIEPVEKIEVKKSPVTRKEIVKELLSLCDKRGVDFDETHELIARIEKDGISND